MLNIGGDTGDAFYRYKMPKLVAKVEGRGNGIKTNVVNNVDIAKALERPPEYIIKYFGCELGAQTKYENGTGTSIVNGAHDSSKLAELLEGFIKKYVQCYSCGNPETVVKVNKKELISLKCKACGYVSDVDPRHKLNTFILKNPPDNKLSKEEKRLKKVEEERLKGADIGKEKKDKKDKKEKKDKKDKKKKKDEDDADPAEEDGKADGAQDSNGAADDDDGDDEEVVWLTDTSEAAIRKRAEEQLTAATAAMVTQGNLEAEQEEARRKAKAAAKKEAELAAKQAEEAAKHAEELAKRAQQISLDDIPTEKLDVAAATELLQVCLMGLEPAQVAKALKKIAVEGGPIAKARALFSAVFGSSIENMASVMKANKVVFVPKDAAAQLANLIAFEHFVGVEHSERMREVPHVLKLMYDEDLAEEEVIIAWYEKLEAGKLLQVPMEAAKLVRQHAAPFAEWLQNADDDEDDDE